MVLSEKMKQLGVWGATLVAAAAYYPRFISDPGGMLFYPSAAACMLRGETPLYCKTTYFAYPPVFAFLMTPFAAMEPWLRDLVWYSILISTLVASLQLSEILTRKLFPEGWTDSELFVFRALTFLLSGKFLLAVLENQSYDSVAFVFVLLGLLALMSGRSLWAGASFAVAAALKVVPLIFLPYLIFKRRYAAAAVFVVVCAFVSVLPDFVLPPNNSSHIVVWLREIGLGPFIGGTAGPIGPFWSGPSPLNQSLRGLVGRAFNDGVQPVQFKVVLYSLIGIYVAVVGLLMLKTRRDDRLIPIDGALLVISMLMLGPVVSRSHFVVLMLPYTLLSAAVIRDRSTRTLGIIVLAASFALATLSSNDLVGPRITDWSYWYGLMTFGTLVLIVYLGALIWSIGQPHGNAAPPGKVAGRAAM